MNKKNSWKEIETKVLGSEPLITEPITEENKNSVLSGILSWYSHFWEVKDCEEYLPLYMSHAKFSTEEIEKAKKINISTLGLTQLYLCRIINKNGDVLPKSTIEKLNNKIKVWMDSEIENTTSNGVKRTNSVQDYIQIKAWDILGILDEEYDSILEDKNHSFIDLYDYFKNNSISSPVVNRIKEYYSKMQEELNNIGVDEYITESYRGYSTKKINQLKDHVTTILNSCMAFNDNQKKLRKPRATKQKPVEKVVKDVKYLKEYSDLKLTSEPPSKVVGSQMVWLYNVKYKHLAVLVSNGKMSIKGTTILDFDSSKSQYKLLRKPQDMIPKVLNGGKVSLKHLMDSIRTKPGKVTGRLNSDTIILRVL